MDMYPVAVPLNAHASIVQVYMYVHVHVHVQGKAKESTQGRHLISAKKELL